MIVLATLAAATAVGAAGGWTAWSEPVTGGGYVLVVRAPDGATTRPPVAPRGVPFDVDLGFSHGRVLAAYSRCAREPDPHGGANPRAAGGLPRYASGRGCSARLLDLAGGTERALARPGTDATEVLPSVAGDALASVVVRRGTPARAVLVVRDLRRGARRVLRTGALRGGPPLTAEGPTSVDTDGARVTSAWRAANRRDRSFDSDVLVQTIAGGRPRVVASATNTGDTPYVTALAPTLSAGRVTYLLSFGQGFCERRWAPRRPNPAYGVQDSGGTGFPVSAAVDGTRLVVAEVGDGEGRLVEYGPRPFTAEPRIGELCG